MSSDPGIIESTVSSTNHNAPTQPYRSVQVQFPASPYFNQTFVYTSQELASIDLQVVSRVIDPTRKLPTCIPFYVSDPTLGPPGPMFSSYFSSLFPRQEQGSLYDSISPQPHVSSVPTHVSMLITLNSTLYGLEAPLSHYLSDVKTRLPAVYYFMLAFSQDLRQQSIVIQNLQKYEQYILSHLEDALEQCTTPNTSQAIHAKMDHLVSEVFQGNGHCNPATPISDGNTTLLNSLSQQKHVNNALPSYPDPSTLQKTLEKQITRQRSSVDIVCTWNKVIAWLDSQRAEMFDQQSPIPIDQQQEQQQQHPQQHVEESPSMHGMTLRRSTSRPSSPHGPPAPDGTTSHAAVPQDDRSSHKQDAQDIPRNKEAQEKCVIRPRSDTKGVFGIEIRQYKTMAERYHAWNTYEQSRLSTLRAQNPNSPPRVLDDNTWGDISSLLSNTSSTTTQANTGMLQFEDVLTETGVPYHLSLITHLNRHFCEQYNEIYRQKCESEVDTKKSTDADCRAATASTLELPPILPEIYTLSSHLAPRFYIEITTIDVTTAPLTTLAEFDEFIENQPQFVVMTLPLFPLHYNSTLCSLAETMMSSGSITPPLSLQHLLKKYLAMDPKRRHPHVPTTTGGGRLLFSYKDHTSPHHGGLVERPGRGYLSSFIDSDGQETPHTDQNKVMTVRATWFREDYIPILDLHQSSLVFSRILHSIAIHYRAIKRAYDQRLKVQAQLIELVESIRDDQYQRMHAHIESIHRKERLLLEQSLRESDARDELLVRQQIEDASVYSMDPQSTMYDDASGDNHHSLLRIDNEANLQQVKSPLNGYSGANITPLSDRSLNPGLQQQNLSAGISSEEGMNTLQHSRQIQQSNRSNNTNTNSSSSLVGVHHQFLAQINPYSLSKHLGLSHHHHGESTSHSSGNSTRFTNHFFSSDEASGSAYPQDEDITQNQSRNVIAAQHKTSNDDHPSPLPSLLPGYRVYQHLYRITNPSPIDPVSYDLRLLTTSLQQLTATQQKLYHLQSDLVCSRANIDTLSWLLQKRVVIASALSKLPPLLAIQPVNDSPSTSSIPSGLSAGGTQSTGDNTLSSFLTQSHNAPSSTGNNGEMLLKLQPTIRPLPHELPPKVKKAEPIQQCVIQSPPPPLPSQPLFILSLSLTSSRENESRDGNDTSFGPLKTTADGSSSSTESYGLRLSLYSHEMIQLQRLLLCTLEEYEAMVNHLPYPPRPGSKRTQMQLHQHPIGFSHAVYALRLALYQNCSHHHEPIYHIKGEPTSSKTQPTITASGGRHAMIALYVPIRFLPVTFARRLIHSRLFNNASHVFFLRQKYRTVMSSLLPSQQNQRFADHTRTLLEESDTESTWTDLLASLPGLCGAEPLYCPLHFPDIHRSPTLKSQPRPLPNCNYCRELNRMTVVIPSLISPEEWFYYATGFPPPVEPLRYQKFIHRQHHAMMKRTQRGVSNGIFSPAMYTRLPTTYDNLINAIHYHSFLYRNCYHHGPSQAADFTITQIYDVDQVVYNESFDKYCQMWYTPKSYKDYFDILYEESDDDQETHPRQNGVPVTYPRLYYDDPWYQELPTHLNSGTGTTTSRASPSSRSHDSSTKKSASSPRLSANIPRHPASPFGGDHGSHAADIQRATDSISIPLPAITLSSDCPSLKGYAGTTFLMPGNEYDDDDDESDEYNQMVHHSHNDFLTTSRRSTAFMGDESIVSEDRIIADFRDIPSDNDGNDDDDNDTNGDRSFHKQPTRLLFPGNGGHGAGPHQQQRFGSTRPISHPQLHHNHHLDDMDDKSSHIHGSADQTTSASASGLATIHIDQRTYAENKMLISLNTIRPITSQPYPYHIFPTHHPRFQRYIQYDRYNRAYLAASLQLPSLCEQRQQILKRFEASDQQQEQYEALFIQRYLGDDIQTILKQTLFPSPRTIPATRVPRFTDNVDPFDAPSTVCQDSQQQLHHIFYHVMVNHHAYCILPHLRLHSEHTQLSTSTGNNQQTTFCHAQCSSAFTQKYSYLAFPSYFSRVDIELFLYLVGLGGLVHHLCSLFGIPYDAYHPDNDRFYTYLLTNPAYHTNDIDIIEQHHHHLQRQWLIHTLTLENVILAMQMVLMNPKLLLHQRVNPITLPDVYRKPTNKRANPNTSGGGGGVGGRSPKDLPRPKRPHADESDARHTDPISLNHSHDGAPHQQQPPQNRPTQIDLPFQLTQHATASSTRNTSNNHTQFSLQKNAHGPAAMKHHVSHRLGVLAPPNARVVDASDDGGISTSAIHPFGQAFRPLQSHPQQPFSTTHSGRPQPTHRIQPPIRTTVQPPSRPQNPPPRPQPQRNANNSTRHTGGGGHRPGGEDQSDADDDLDGII